MTDEQIQANADRAHTDSAAMTAAIQAQTAAMTASQSIQQQLLDQYKALAAKEDAAPPSVSFTEPTLLELAKQVAAIMTGGKVA